MADGAQVTNIDDRRERVVEDEDVIIVGAGISGIDMAYRLQTRLPDMSYRIFEARENMGGTWDLFRYPGIRSDSDMYTLGFPFRPWPKDHPIAEGHEIREYVEDTARQFGIDRRISYGRKVTGSHWRSDEARWYVSFEENGERGLARCKYLVSCTGYYDYDRGYMPTFPGIDDFGGEVIHPQHWRSADLEGKRVLVIGSGATAVSLIPAVAERAGHVEMLQRTPTYIVYLPGRANPAEKLRGRIPRSMADRGIRWAAIGFSMYFYRLARKYPEQAKARMIGMAKKHLAGTDIDVEKHFTPPYNPWDQRICLDPDGKFYETLREGTTTINTDTIDRFDANGVILSSGERIDADIVIPATGLNLSPFGGIAVQIDGEDVSLPERVVYRGCMLSGVPNFAFMIGYVNASWTLRVDLVAKYFVRMVKAAQRRGQGVFAPMNPPAEAEGSVMSLNSGYVQRSAHLFPRQSGEAPWRSNQNYLADVRDMGFASLDDGAMTFDPPELTATTNVTVNAAE